MKRVSTILLFSFFITFSLFKMMLWCDDVNWVYLLM